MNIDPSTMTLADAEAALTSEELPPDLRLTREQIDYLGPALLREHAARARAIAEERRTRGATAG